MVVHLRNDSVFLLSTRVARMLLTPRWVSRQKQCEIVTYKYIKASTRG